MSNIQLSGIFQIISWDENTYFSNDNGLKQTTAAITQTYSGDINAESITQYVMTYHNDAQASFTGFETLTINNADMQGIIVLEHRGMFEDGVARSSFKLVIQSGTGTFKLATGTGKFVTTDNGQAEYVVDIMLAKPQSS